MTENATRPSRPSWRRAVVVALMVVVGLLLTLLVGWGALVLLLVESARRGAPL